MKEHSIRVGFVIIIVLLLGWIIWDKTANAAQMPEPLKATELNIKIKGADGKEVVVPISEVFAALQASSLQLIKTPDGKEVTLQYAIYQDLQKIKAAAGIKE